MEYEAGSIPKGALLGGRSYMTASTNTNAIKQTEAQEILGRLSSLSANLNGTLELAAGTANKVLGPRPEGIADAKEAYPPSHGFLGELRNLVTRLEAMPGAINSHLNRIDQSF